MTDLCHSDPCVIFALARECGPFLREFRPQQKFPGAPCRARFCGPAWLSVLVLEVGVGHERARQAIDWALSSPKMDDLPYRPSVVISAGFSGALDPGLKVGDVVLADAVIEEDGTRHAVTWPPGPLEGAWDPPLHRGGVFTSSRLIGDPAEKKAVGEQRQAIAVEMESAMIARACAARSVPFGCVRVISDDAHTPLSVELAEVAFEGRVGPLKLAGAICRRPRLIPELWRLGKDTRLAARQLGKALGELLTLTLSWLDEEPRTQ